jgi:outer membrane protein assembly factor BamD
VGPSFGTNLIEIRTCPVVALVIRNFPAIMKKILVISMLIFIAGCAAKEGPFDPATAFHDAEVNMRKENFEKARKEYQEIQEKSPDKSYDAALMLRIADTYYGEEKYDEALVEYQAFLNFHPVHKDAVYAQFQVAMCSFKQMTTIDRDPTPTRTALKEFQTFLQKYPRSVFEEPAVKNASLCRDRLSEYELYIGRFYHKKGAYKAAVGRLDDLLRTYPGSAAEKDALYYDGLSYLELNERDRARAVFETLIKKYPSMKGSVASLTEKLAKN